MPYHLTSADIAPPVRLTHGLRASPWLRAQLRPELGRCFVDSATLDDGLSLVYAHYAPARDLLETSALQRARRLDHYCGPGRAFQHSGRGRAAV